MWYLFVFLCIAVVVLSMVGIEILFMHTDAIIRWKQNYYEQPTIGRIFKWIIVIYVIVIISLIGIVQYSNVTRKVIDEEVRTCKVIKMSCDNSARYVIAEDRNDPSIRFKVDVEKDEYDILLVGDLVTVEKIVTIDPVSNKGEPIEELSCKPYSE